MMQTELASLAQHTDLLDLAIFDNRETAELFCQYVESRGIDSSIYDEGDLQMFFFLTKPAANNKVQVRDEDYTEAVTCLIDFENQYQKLLPIIYSCPDCGCFEVQHPQFSRKFITPLLLDWLSNPCLFSKQCYCHRCQATWPKQRAAQINPRHLEWNTDISVPLPA